jgi:hypothetical protein
MEVWRAHHRSVKKALTFLVYNQVKAVDLRPSAAAHSDDSRSAALGYWFCINFSNHR